MKTGIEIKTKKSMVGNKLTVEQSHMAEIEKYIRLLEAKNSQLLKEKNSLGNEVEEKSLESTRFKEENEQLAVKVKQQESEIEKLEDSLSDLSMELMEEREGSQWLYDGANDKIISMIEHVPNADEYSKSYDLLSDYQRKLESRTNTSNEYNMGDGEVAIIAKYGLDVAEEFVSKDQALIPMKHSGMEAKVHLSGDSYEQNDGGSINLYSDYSIVVDLIDKASGEIKETHDLYDFAEVYKDDILDLAKKREAAKEQPTKDAGIDSEEQTKKDTARKKAYLARGLER